MSKILNFYTHFVTTSPDPSEGGEFTRHRDGDATFPFFHSSLFTPHSSLLTLPSSSYRYPLPASGLC